MPLYLTKEQKAAFDMFETRRAKFGISEAVLNHFPIALQHIDHPLMRGYLQKLDAVWDAACEEQCFLDKIKFEVEQS